MTIELALINGRIHTVDSQNRTVEALAISGNTVTSVGSTEQILALTSGGTHIVDLKGACAIPGIIDSHNHVFSAGVLLDGVMLFDANNMADLKDMVRARAEKVPKGGWVLGGGWIESQFSEYRLPNRQDLDEAAPHHPVILDRLFGMSVVNSKALQLAGIGAGTPDPERGTIDRDASGNPTGILRNGAQSLVDRVMPQGDTAEEVQELERLGSLALNEYPKYGITSLVDPGVSPLGMRAYQNLLERGSLPVRVNMMPAWYGLNSTADKNLDTLIETLGVYTGFGNSWLSLGALKMAVDGGLGSKTAMLNEPYTDGHVSNIPLRLDLSQLENYFRAAQTAGWSIGIHCCGDLAQDIVLETFDRVINDIPNPRARHNIIHGYLPTDKALEIMSRHNISVSCQPGFMYCEGDLYFDLVEVRRINYFKPLRTYTEHGIAVACNSDITSAHFNPFLGMYAAVARTTSQGRKMGENERIDRKTMLRMFTLNGAYLTREEHLKGSLEPGKLADVAILSDDIYTVRDEDILKMTVTMTITDGKIVFRR